MTNLVYIIFVPVWLVGLFLLTSYVLYHKILIPYKLTVSDTSFEELLIALNAAIQTEFDLFEKNVFVDKTAITNSNFDNFYFEMTEHIIKSLSPLFYKKMTQFITEDALYSIIGRKVKEYLTGKINGAV